jgi:DNA-binding MarR family transcriptional regulator
VQKAGRHVKVLDQSRTDQLNEALELLHFAFRKVMERPDAILAQHGLTRVHHRILYFVARHPACSVGELLAILGVSKQALHAPLRRLIRDGYIDATAPATNRRLKLLRLSERGTALEDLLSSDQRARFAAVFDACGPEAERSWRSIMRALAQDDAESIDATPDLRSGKRDRLRRIAAAAATDRG